MLRALPAAGEGRGRKGEFLPGQNKNKSLEVVLSFGKKQTPRTDRLDVPLEVQTSLCLEE